MLLNHLISQEVPVASPSDNIDYINSLFFASKLQEIPVIEGGHYLGLIDQDELQKHEGDPEPLTPDYYAHTRPAIGIHAHPFEALRILHMHNLSILPVLLEDQEYAGSITKDNLLTYLVDNISIDVNGGLIVLEVEPRNYSLSQIARICENEQVIILGVHVKTNLDTAKLEVTIKTNSTDLAGVTQAFERFEYTILDTYGDQKLENDIVDRYKLLMNYINM